MLKITGTDIHLTRGDTAYLQVPIETEVNGVTSDYEIRENDTLRFTVKESAWDETFLIQKVLEGSNNFHIAPEDTKELKYGSYTYDVELTTGEGDVFTVITPSVFKVTKEVTW